MYNMRKLPFISSIIPFLRFHYAKCCRDIEDFNWAYTSVRYSEISIYLLYLF